MQSLNYFLLGGVAVACLTAGVFFLRFWRSTKDRFFLYFAASFLIEGVNRLTFGFMADLNEDSPIKYLVRALTYVLILFAILDKNMPRKEKNSSVP
ncbi:MAG TPA: DUF5985 family protein [Burkholderiales bacterium]